MAEKKSGWAAYNERVRNEAQKQGKKSAKKAVKKVHTATKVVAVLCAVIGIVVGAVVCLTMSKNDRFLLKGQTDFSIDAGTTYTYTEEGVEAYCFGRDVSDKLSVEVSEGITRDANGNYVIPAEEGVYTITYTVDCIKFGENAPNGIIKRIRVFSVDAVEDDGRGGTVSEEVAD